MKIAKKKMFWFPKSNILSATIVMLIAGTVGFASLYFYTASNSQAQYVSNCKGFCVALAEKQAQPDALAVPVGSYVQFDSADGKTHSLSLGEGGHEHSHTGKFSSGDFRADEAWRVQFNQEGSFVFHDHYNPKINVIVVVYTPGKDYKVQ